MAPWGTYKDGTEYRDEYSEPKVRVAGGEAGASGKAGGRQGAAGHVASVWSGECLPPSFAPLVWPLVTAPPIPPPPPCWAPPPQLAAGVAELRATAARAEGTLRGLPGTATTGMQASMRTATRPGGQAPTQFPLPLSGTGTRAFYTH